MTTAVTPARAPFLGGVSLARNVLTNWTAMAFTILATFFITPVVVGHLESESYGVWSFLNGLLVYSDLLYVGLGTALIKFVAAYQAQSNYAGLNRLASTVLAIYASLGLLCLAVFAVISPYVPLLFARPLLTPAAEAAATTACVLLGVQLLASFVGSAFSGVLYGLERIDLVGMMRIIMLICRSAAIVFFVQDGPQALVVLATITATSAVAETIGLAVLTVLVDRRLRVRIAMPTWSELRVLYGFGLQAFIALFALTLINYTDTTVVGITIGAASVALYALPQQLVEYIRQTVAGVSGVMLPRLTVLSEKGDMAGLRHAYLTLVRVTMFLGGLLSANMVLLGSPFLGLWVGPQFAEPARWVVLLLSAAMVIHLFGVGAPMGFFQAMGLLKFPAVVLLLEAAANLVLSLILARRMGLVGVAVGTVIPALIAGFVIMPPYLWRRLGLRPAPVLSALLPAAAVSVLTLVVAYGLTHVVGVASYGQLLLIAVLTAPGAALVFVTMFPRDERTWVLRRIGATLDQIGRFSSGLAARLMGAAAPPGDDRSQG